MDVLFRKEQKLCATCIYWDGKKEISSNAINTDFNCCGRCEFPNNFPISQRLASEHACLKHTLATALK
jgi:predicted PP-loop superfamily ATPase